MLLHARTGLATLLLAGMACAPSPKAESGAAAAGLSSADEAAIRKVDTEWARAASAGDGNAIAALYADDATVLPPNEPMKEGEAAKKYWVDFTHAFSGSAELNTRSVEGGGGLAYVVGTYSMTLTPKQAGAKALPTEEGKYVEVLRRQPDGLWKIVHDIWNANTPAKQ